VVKIQPPKQIWIGELKIAQSNTQHPGVARHINNLQAQKIVYLSMPNPQFSAKTVAPKYCGLHFLKFLEF
jgi:hypothetical protein